MFQNLGEQTIENMRSKSKKQKNKYIFKCIFQRIYDFIYNFFNDINGRTNRRIIPI